MKCYSHLADQVLLRDAASALARRCANTAEVLAYLAEIHERKLYVPAGYPSMSSYCIHHFRMSEASAHKFIRAERAAREFPAIFMAVEDGRLHLSAVVMLAPFLKPDSADDLLAAAAGKTKSEIELILAERFPKPDVPARIESLSPPDAQASLSDNSPRGELSEVASPDCTELRAPRSRVKPLAPERFSVQFTFGKEAHDRLRHAEALLSHQIRPGDIAEVLDRALKFFVSHLEKRKFGATDRPRAQRRASQNPRSIPAHVKRAVRERDGGQCTFVGDNGHRCEARTRLEFDHVEEVARGGTATVSNIRLRCRTHNQYTAERTFGDGFMEQKRREARRAAAEKRARADAEKRAQEEARAAAEQAGREAREKAREVIPGLRQLGFRADEVRRAAKHCESIPEASLEERIRASLKLLVPIARQTTRQLGAG